MNKNDALFLLTLIRNDIIPIVAKELNISENVLEEVVKSVRLNYKTAIDSLKYLNISVEKKYITLALKDPLRLINELIVTFPELADFVIEPSIIDKLDKKAIKVLLTERPFLFFDALSKLSFERAKRLIAKIKPKEITEKTAIAIAISIDNYPKEDIINNIKFLRDTVYKNIIVRKLIYEVLNKALSIPDQKDKVLSYLASCISVSDVDEAFSMKIIESISNEVYKNKALGKMFSTFMVKGLKKKLSIIEYRLSDALHDIKWASSRYDKWDWKRKIELEKAVKSLINIIPGLSMMMNENPKKAKSYLDQTLSHIKLIPVYLYKVQLMSRIALAVEDMNLKISLLDDALRKTSLLSDDEKSKALNYITSAISDIAIRDPSTALSLLDRAFSIAESITDKVYKVKAFRNVASVISVIALIDLNKALSITNSVFSRLYRVETLSNIARTLMLIDQDKASAILDDALSLAKLISSSKYKFDKALALSNIASTVIIKDPEKAVSMLNDAISIAESISGNYLRENTLRKVFSIISTLTDISPRVLEPIVERAFSIAKSSKILEPLVPAISAIIVTNPKKGLAMMDEVYTIAKEDVSLLSVSLMLQLYIFKSLFYHKRNIWYLISENDAISLISSDYRLLNKAPEEIVEKIIDKLDSRTLCRAILENKDSISYLSKAKLKALFVEFPPLRVLFPDDIVKSLIEDMIIHSDYIALSKIIKENNRFVKYLTPEDIVNLMIHDERIFDVLDNGNKRSIIELLSKNNEKLLSLPERVIMKIAPTLPIDLIRLLLRHDKLMIIRVINKNKVLVEKLSPNDIEDLILFLVEQKMKGMVSFDLYFESMDILIMGLERTSRIKIINKIIENGEFDILTDEDILNQAMYSDKLVYSILEKMVEAKKLDLYKDVSTKLFFRILSRRGWYLTEKLIAKDPKLVRELFLKLISSENTRNIIEYLPESFLEDLMRYMDINLIIDIMPYLPLTLSVAIYRNFKERYKSRWFDILMEKVDDKPMTANMKFLVALFNEPTIKTKVALDRLAKIVYHKDCKLIAEYIFERKELSKNKAINLIEKYPQFALWLREDLAIELVDSLDDIFSKYKEVLDYFLLIGGIVSKKTLKWLGVQVTSGKMDAQAVAKLIISRNRPFNAKVFSKVKKN